MHPFPYDRFQEEAIQSIRKGISVFVSAPTGAGKTVIAEVAVEEALRAGGMAIYTAPIKALSNQKFRDFHALYGERVGILTGDVTLNPDAPLLIMTTEIYRNTLFEGSTRFSRCRWVIFDEIHYLDDPERGTVWEEALLLTPRQTEILALSATIPNAEQLARWIERIHGRPVRVIQEEHRPVPLTFAFQCEDELLWNLATLKANGYRGQDRLGGTRPQARMRRSRHGRLYFKRGPGSFGPPSPLQPKGRANRADHLLRQIQSANHLPCLYFTFSRRRAEDLAWEFAALGLIPKESRSSLLEQFDQLCQRQQISGERSAGEMRELISQGVAYHHAGILPTLKEVIEVLFTRRLIGIIVTTETFALGINMPARSVVLDTLSRRANGPRTVLRVRDLWQMAGRAGRRGMDETGFVYLRVNPWEISFHEMEHLLHGKPEEVSSRFSLTYATLLNLYRHYETDLVPFYQKTLHAFQAPQLHQRETLALVNRKLSLLKELGCLRPKGLTPKGIFAANLYGYELILSELFEIGFLDQLNLTDLGILLLATVYEPRRGSPFRPGSGQAPAKLPHRIQGMASQVNQVLETIHRQERRFRVGPLSKGPSFQLSMAMERWLGGAAFDKTVALAGLDEGEIIRYFRMTIQLARSLTGTPTASHALKGKAFELLKRINRDPVDAEAELRRSL
ncbi:MAG: DEAD/DEAH box helicase [Candidatus Omnitrophica bacterium]|nr:DEAD/DEAH box helicase [Candidatus Omnitrophota bacterium]